MQRVSNILAFLNIKNVLRATQTRVISFLYVVHPVRLSHNSLGESGLVQYI